MKNIKISSASFLAAINQFTADINDVRTYLQGVLIEPHAEKGITLTASNGISLATLHDRHGSTNGKYLLHLSYPKHEAQTLGLSQNFANQIQLKKNTAEEVLIDNAPYRANSEDFVNAAIDRQTHKIILKGGEQFPDWKRLFTRTQKDHEKKDHTKNALISSEELNKHRRAAKFLSSSKRGDGLKIQFGSSANEAILTEINSEYGATLFGMSMPMHDVYSEQKRIDIPQNLLK